MTQKQIDKLRKKIEALRRKGGVKSTEIESLAKACGRSRSKRGKEPVWINKTNKRMFPLSIPHHSTGLGRGIANKILDQIEMDLDRFEQDI